MNKACSLPSFTHGRGEVSKNTKTFTMIEPFKKKALTRLKRAKGQIEGIMKMIEEGKYCADVITQVLALQGAVKGISPLILESHLNTCGAEALNSKNQARKEKFIKEIIRSCNLSNR